MKGSPYRNMPRKIYFVDYMNYYNDAISIGFSRNKALDYAWKCCMEEIEEKKILLAAGHEID